MTSYTPGWFSRALDAPFADRTVEVGGVAIHYLYWAGDDAAQEKPGLVFVHGNVSSGRFFEETMAALPGSYRAIAPDLRGFGDSDSLAVDADGNVRHTSTDQFGLYRIDNLAPGTYRVTAEAFGGGTASGTVVVDGKQDETELVLRPVR